MPDIQADSDLLASHVRPFGVDPLPPGALACHVCGVAVFDGPEQEFASTTLDAKRGMVLNEGTVTFRTCDACTERHGHAGALVAEHPDVRRAIGSTSVAEHRVALALDALAAIGQALPDHLTGDELRRAVQLLTPVARRWSSKFAPVRQADAVHGSCAEAPFAWLDTTSLRDLRHTGAVWLAWRLPPREHPCPTVGCGFCGVGAVIARRPAKPWTAHALSPAALGGNGPKPLPVHLCLDCEGAYSDPLPTGSALLSALLASVDPDHRLRQAHPGDPDLRGVIGWAVSGRTKPNREPWDHLNPAAVRVLLEGHDW